MTEGNERAIDPAGEARRALQAAVAQHGAQALSNAVIMDGICRDRLSNLPGEAILIGSAARTDVPALLRDRVPREGTYGAIQSVAVTLAEAHALDRAASVWVVREYARALGIIAPGGTQTVAHAGPAAEQGEGQGGGGPGSRGVNRNALGIGAAIALVLVYLGIAAAAHLSPFPAKTVASAPDQGGNASSSVRPAPDAAPDAGPDAGPDPAPDPSPASAYDTLLSLIPSSVQGQDNCHDDGASVGATAVAQCANLVGLAATTIDYYLYASPEALVKGFTSFLTSVKFPSNSRVCTTGNKFAGFVAQCKGSFTSTSPDITGSVAEYVSTQNNSIIVSTDNQQLVMGVLIGPNEAGLLAYWKPLQWIQAQG
ncbi:MAG: hypothetical protein M3Z75_27845 [Actinomycetota bacterium]|nr:hypothetical protein [Actinomycetota bacterium]